MKLSTPPQHDDPTTPREPFARSRKPHNVYTLQFLGVVLLLAVALLLSLCIARDYMLPKLADSLIVGPGAADYSFDIVGDYSLVRMGSNRRCIIRADPELNSPADGGLGDLVVGWDVTQLGWNDKFIVCYQARNEHAYPQYSGWWIIDTRTHDRFGPLSETDCQDKVRVLEIPPPISVHPVEDYGRTGVRDSP